MPIGEQLITGTVALMLCHQTTIEARRRKRNPIPGTT